MKRSKKDYPHKIFINHNLVDGICITFSDEMGFCLLRTQITVTRERFTLAFSKTESITRTIVQGRRQGFLKDTAIAALLAKTENTSAIKIDFFIFSPLLVKPLLMHKKSPGISARALNFKIILLLHNQDSLGKNRWLHLCCCRGIHN